MGFGGKLGKIASGLGGGLNNLLMGTKSQGSGASYTPLMDEQRKSLGLYNKQLDSFENLNPEQMAAAQVAQQEQNARSQAGDVERNAQALVAQRGLSNSSVGLNAILGAKRGLGDQLNSIRAQQPGIQNQLQNDQINRLGALSGGINSIYDTRAYTPSQAASPRQGGLLGQLLGAAGSVAGSYYGAKK